MYVCSSNHSNGRELTNFSKVSNYINPSSHTVSEEVAGKGRSEEPKVEKQENLEEGSPAGSNEVEAKVGMDERSIRGMKPRGRAKEALVEDCRNRRNNKRKARERQVLLNEGLTRKHHKHRAYSQEIYGSSFPSIPALVL